MVFSQRLADAQSAVETHLAAFIAASGRDGAPDRLVTAMRHAVLGGGKRLRPFLVIESGRLFDVAPGASLDVAAALECIHCYSLAHDDLPAMDNDLLRRGKPTVWAAFDEWTAILAGDGLLTLAFEILVASGSPIAPGAQAEIIRELAKASGPAGMVGGQVLDLMADKLGMPAVATIEGIQRLQAMKTGALIRFAAEAGAILASAPAAERSALATFGQRIGFAFQIADDILDAEGDAAIVGKAVAKDAAAGKATLVGLLGLDAAKARLAEAEKTAIAALAPFGARADTLREVARFVVARRN